MKIKSGLTLMELLIAASIFSVIILSIYSVFHTGILSYNRIDSAAEVYQSARIMLKRMELDLKNSFIYAQDDSRFQGKPNYMEFFTLVDYFSEGENLSNLCLIKYEVGEGTIKRIPKRNLDALKADVETEGEILSENVEKITFAYAAVATNNPETPYEWKDEWPDLNDDKQKTNLPLAVKITLTLRERDRRGELLGSREFTKVVSLPCPES
jgi:prepilin-type N-terminal cleavage/methylation domain-containing protein